jgi:hypothetical protein
MAQYDIMGIPKTPIEIIDYMGFKSYSILFWLVVIITIFRAKYNLLLVYIIFYYICRFIVRLLKPIIREPRPTTGLENSRPGSLPFIKFPSYMKEDLSDDIEKWGMPSGHAACTIYSLAFIWWAGDIGLTKDTQTAVFAFACFVALAMYYQRWWYEKHTAAQLFIGTLLGVFLGYWSVWFYKVVVRGKKIGRKEDLRFIDIED